ncbi:MAG: M55 family metallopeptidase [Oscillospiraceae bacterium]
MKLFISSDIEGTCGITHWDETDYDRGGRWYDYFREQMSREVAAACEGALAAGAKDILVKDAHDSARNIIPTLLPRPVHITRGWSGHPYVMVDGLAKEFDALAFTGYHSPAYCGGNPLSHTMATNLDKVVINGQLASEFTIHSYIAAMLGVPVVFLSGDETLCGQAKELVSGITTVAVNRGKGNSATSMHPLEAQEKIREGMQKALSGNLEACKVKLPAYFTTEVTYKEHPRAYRCGQFPGARMADDKTIVFESANYEDILRFYLFVL